MVFTYGHKTRKKSTAKSTGVGLGAGAKKPSGGGAKKQVIREEFTPPSVALSSRDRAPQLKISRDQLEISGNGGGFRMVRATHGVHIGAYYCEAEILPPVIPAPAKNANPVMIADIPDSHVRIGWSTRQGDLQAPLGHDKHGYAYRDISGSKIHASTRDDDYGESFGPGDIIGLYLKIDLEEVSNNEIRFFKNGRDQGVAFRGVEIPLGVYFPAIAVYQYARVRMNFGPSFILQHDIYGANALSEVQPMSPQDRRDHEVEIAARRQARQAVAAPAPAPSTGAPSADVSAALQPSKLSK